MLRRVVAIAATIAVLAVVNVVVVQRERLLADGRVVRLELAPVDPRSLMQGDYMALQFQAANDARPQLAAANAADGALVLAVDARGIGRFLRLDDGRPLGAHEVRLRYRVRDQRVRIVTNAWFFEEGQRDAFAKARYGELRVAPGGEALLARMLDDALRPIEPGARR